VHISFYFNTVDFLALKFSRSHKAFAVRYILVALACAALPGLASAQIEDYTFGAPPPVKLMSKGEASQLATKHDVKDRTKLALELMSIRLTKAEEFSTKGEFQEMYNELGAFHALMDNTLDFLYDSSRGRDKNLDTFKRFEMTLRAFAPRLGVIRRELPTEYDPYVRNLIKYLRDARSRAVEPLFGDMVVPNRRT